MLINFVKVGNETLEILYIVKKFLKLFTVILMN